ncbi:NADPH-dependent F420 reductase [Nocardia sp. NPDC006044]|uniref:NADPH-dependent F420 reductase n=1 Tax=Nocardia sp. NPDC006044 TaxID=3364306 RepID=UPI0036915863
MIVGVIGTGRIGGNIARQAVRTGHEVIVSFTRNPQSLIDFAVELGDGATAGAARDAVIDADLTVLAVPWPAIDVALGQAGTLHDAIIVDTTNHYGGVGPVTGQTAAAFNAERMPGARYTKSFNTLTAAFQAQVAGRVGDDRVVQWLCGDDRGAKDVVSAFIDSLGYLPVDLGGIKECAVMESPRRAGAVYGEEYHRADAEVVVAAVRAGREIPPAPLHS